MEKEIKMISTLYKKIKVLSCMNKSRAAKERLSISSIKTVNPKEAKRLRQNTLRFEGHNNFFSNLLTSYISVNISLYLIGLYHKPPVFP